MQEKTAEYLDIWRRFCQAFPGMEDSDGWEPIGPKQSSGTATGELKVYPKGVNIELSVGYFQSPWEHTDFFTVMVATRRVNFDGTPLSFKNGDPQLKALFCDNEERKTSCKSNV